MLFWFGVFFVLGIFFTPTLWQRAGSIQEKIGWQLTKVLLALLLGWLVGWLILMDHTVSAIISNATFYYLILLIADGMKSSTKDSEMGKLAIFSILGLISVVVWIGATWIYPLTIKKDMYDLVQVEEKTEKLAPTDINHIATVPIENAHYKAEKLIGQLANSSYYELGQLSRQKIAGEEFWVAPLEYRGFFEYLKADSVPGYIKVSAEREDEPAVLVDDYKMQYVPSAYFGDYLTRKVRSEFPQDIIFGGGFEPDDEGKPFYVVAVGHYDKFRDGEVIDGAVILDPQTGRMTKYAIKDVPAFVDFVMPPKVASSRNEYKANWKHGLFNAYFGKQDVTEVTRWNTGEEVIGVFGPDNKMYWFTDHTTPGTNSLVGYSLIDGRTGSYVYYTGSKGFANGRAALQAVHNTFKRELWHGTNPILYNIYGTETWYIPVIDANGLLREIALVNAQNPQIVAHGASKQEALNDYKFKLATDKSNGSVTPTDAVSAKVISGKVTRVGAVTIGESQVIQVLLEGSDKVFNINPKQSVYASFIKEGDMLKVSYVDTEESMVSADKIFNETLKK